MYEFWEQRYREEGYAYGEAPNVFFKQIIDTLEPGKLLLPAEGEGRNAVYAAKRGWDVDAYDFSEQAILKAQEFADLHNVDINYQHGSHTDLSAYQQQYDAIGLIYAHVPNSQRRQFHQQLARLLKPGGVFIFEAFTTQQLGRSSGGPQVIEMLYQIEDVREDFSEICTIEVLQACEEELDEGKYHVGLASFLRMKAIRK